MTALTCYCIYVIMYLASSFLKGSLGFLDGGR